MIHVTRRLPDRPHLDVPRREARALLADWKKGDRTALERLRAQHPRLKHLTLEEIAAAPARLADAQWVVAREYTYATWAELKQRIAKTVDFLRTVKADMFKDAEGRSIELKFPNGTQKFTALTYLTDFVLPNFYFHISMVYALLRKSGVEIGKPDYLGPRP